MNSELTPQYLPHDIPSKALNILSFLCPPLGLVIYLVLVGKLPRQAASAGRFAIKGVWFIVGIFCLLTLVSLTMWVLDDVFNVWGSTATQSVGVAKPPRP